MLHFSIEKLYLSRSHVSIESQHGWGWKGPLKSNPSAEQDHLEHIAMLKDKRNAVLTVGNRRILALQSFDIQEAELRICIMIISRRKEYFHVANCGILKIVLRAWLDMLDLEVKNFLLKICGDLISCAALEI